MRVNKSRRARPTALGGNDEPRGDLPGEVDHFGNGTYCNGSQDLYRQFRHHVDCPARRRKTLAELIDGAELIEIYDRCFPGRMAKAVQS